MSLEERVISVVSEDVGQSVALDTRFDALGLDSMEFLCMLAAIANSIRKVPNELIYRLDTVQDLVNVLKELGEE